MGSSHTVVNALDTDQVKNVSLIAIVAVVIIGFIISWFVTKIVAHIVVLVVVVVLGFVLYSQRQKVVDEANKLTKRCDASFFGIHVQPSDPTIKKACDAANGKLPK